MSTEDFLTASFARCDFHRHMNLELEPIEPGRVRVWARHKPVFDQGMGIMHGGVYAVVMDAATYYAVLSHYGYQRPLPLTQEYKLNLVSSVVQEDIYADASLLHAGRSSAVAEAKIRSASGKLVAAGMASFRIRQENK